MITGPISNNNAGMAAFSRFATANTWPAAQTFSVAATFSAGFTSTGLLQSTSSSTTVGGVLSRASGTISANPPAYATCAFQSVGAQSTSATNMFDACGGAPTINLRRRNGTYSAQTTTAVNDITGQIDASGFDSVTFRQNALIQMYAVETFTSTANGTAMLFQTTPAGTTTLTTRLTLNNTANFTVPVVTTETQINGAVATNRFLYWQTSGSIRWGWYANNEAEGSNAGSNLLLARYSDAGGLLAGAVITITRANGNITMNGGGGKTTFAGNAINIATAQTPATSAAAGTTGDIAWDDTYLYVRMSTGWRRIALGAAF